MNTRTVILIAVLFTVLITVLVFARRSQRVLHNGLPERILCTSQAEAQRLAGPTAIAVLGTGSMAPFIPPAPIGINPLTVVCAYAVPASGVLYKDITPGALVVYAIEYVKGHTTMHQAALLDGGGWIMTGLHNKGYETNVRVTKENFIAVVSKVYIWSE